MIRINQVKLNIFHTEDDFKRKISKLLKINYDIINNSEIKIINKSIDARNKSDLKLSYNVIISFKDKIDENKLINKIGNNNICKYYSKNFNPHFENIKKFDYPPIIVGFGPAGIFAAYIFVLNGIKPIIIERGQSIENRVNDIDEFLINNKFNPNSNICFGEGGAGTFSDGKLNTGNKDKMGYIEFILKTFVKYGADENILYENLPHIGTDKLRKIIINIRNEILNLGGKIHYNTKFTYNDYKNYKGQILLATGNSSRDTYRDLYSNGFDIKLKPFAIGYRIIHKQSLINESLYGTNDEKIIKLLGNATYKLVHKININHSVYSFCMCPGGYVINSSTNKNLLSINGMSYYDRNGSYANSAIVENINVDDFYNQSPLSGIELQEKLEEEAFNLNKNYIPYCFLKDLKKQYSNTKNINIKEIDTRLAFFNKAIYNEKVINILSKKNLEKYIKLDINNDIFNSITAFEKNINGFSNNNTIISAIETKTSAPIKLDRDENMMCNVKNFYPCGEGFGFGGGIISSAIDGIKVASKILGGE